MPKTQTGENNQIGFVVRILAADVIDKLKAFKNQHSSCSTKIEHLDPDYDVILTVHAKKKSNGL